jgi:hypothetical protein
VAAVTVLAYFLFGGAVALRQTTVAGIGPTFVTLRSLALDAVTSWKDLLTVVPPAAAFPDVMIVPFLSCLVVAVLAGSLALRARRPGWALLPLAALTVGTILLGTAQVAWPIGQGIAFDVSLPVRLERWCGGRRERCVPAGFATPLCCSLSPEP